jgi:hypothetical protein
MYSLSFQQIKDRPILQDIAEDDFLIIGDASDGNIVKRLPISTLTQYLQDMLYQVNPSVTSASTAKSAVKPIATANTAVLIASADPTRLGLNIINTGNKPVVLGTTNAVTVGTGLITIAVGQGYNFPVPFTGEVYGVSATAAQSVNVIEFN